jgi:hypothetical protein
MFQKEILDDKRKTGFNINVGSMFDLKSDYMKKNILNKRNKIFNIINRDRILALLNDKNNIKKYGKFIFSFINTSIFLNKYAVKK